MRTSRHKKKKTTLKRKAISIVTCDNKLCTKEFGIHLQQRKEGEGDAAIWVFYFKCPHCKKVYETSRITPYGLKLQKKIKKLRENKKSHTEEYAALMLKYQSEVRAVERA